jgi:8-oxo-dGTP pyrophosphatase MutT (NUDIX family)
MKIFISWSGTEANEIALLLRAWLPQVNVEFDTFVSSESIGAGKPWFEEVRAGLKSSDFGIGIFTKENLHSTWMFFEHGAIAGQKDFAPLLCGCELQDLKGTPATVFQAKLFQRGPFSELVFQLNERCNNRHGSDQFRKLFSKLWPDLNKRVLAILSEGSKRRAIAPTVATAFSASARENGQLHGVEVLPPYADLELQKIFRDASDRIDCLVLSGRNLFSPAVFETMRERIEEQDQGSKVRILAMDVYSDGHFLEHRKEMMGSGLSRNNYARDLDAARENAKNLALLDPEHKKFDVRFYNLMPTQFYYLVDNVLYLTFVLSTPVGRCPVIKIDLTKHPELGKTFSDHFEHYWSSSRYFVSVVAFNAEGLFLMVKNRKRGWEWPGGFIEPNEDPRLSAMREFREESGYDILDVCEIRRDAAGTFYAGRLGSKQTAFSEREMESVDLFAALPKQNDLSFPSQRAAFAEVLEDARAQFLISPGASPKDD